MTHLLDFVEIKTKITSVFAFLLALAYLFAAGTRIDVLRSAVFFAGMFLFDLTATAINNYYDTKKNGLPLSLPRPAAKGTMIALFLASIFFGLYLYYLTDLVVLTLGGVCFFFGVLYSFGPVPLSHGPYGEIVSGFFYGAVIPAILVYINVPEGSLLSYSFSGASLNLQINMISAIGIALLAIVPFCLTANIMFANNICDVERDVAVGRFTLPYYLKSYALPLFSAFYYLAYLSVVVMVITGFLTPLSLLLLVTIIPVQKNINIFHKKQIKEETFIISIKNFLLIITVHIALIIIGGILLR
ncbi:UbiA family prenyltransferase [Oscillospiraceae bacterium WX1]